MGQTKLIKNSDLILFIFLEKKNSNRTESNRIEFFKQKVIKYMAYGHIALMLIA